MSNLRLNRWLLRIDDLLLDTLFLALPISWRGTLQQYVGRIYRQHENKRAVQVYDYVDANVTMLMRMNEKRMKGYKTFGYAVHQETSGMQYQLTEGTSDGSERERKSA